MGRRVARLILFVLVGLVAARKLRAAKGAKRKAKHKKVQFADDDDDDVGDEESNLRGGPSDDDDDDEAGGDGAGEDDDDEADDDEDAYGDDDDDAYGDDDDDADGWSEGEAEASEARPPRGTRPSKEELRERRRERKLEQEAMRLKHEKSRHKKHHRKSHTDGFATMEARAGDVEDWDGRRLGRTLAADLRTEEGLFKGGDEAAAMEQVRFERELERMREDPGRKRVRNSQLQRLVSRSVSTRFG